MKKTIDHLLNGQFIQKRTPLLFSENPIRLNLMAGDTHQGEIFIGTEDEERIRGYITSDNRRIVPGLDRFSGSHVRLPYGIDCKGLKSGDEINGALCFVTNLGEYTIPVHIEVRQNPTAGRRQECGSAEEFVNFAKEDFRDACRYFSDAQYPSALMGDSDRALALCRGFRKNPVTYQNLEEYLITMGRKEPVSLSLREETVSYYEVTQTTMENIHLMRSGWGHIRLDVETTGAFLEVSKRVITDSDFVGSICTIPLIIHRERLGNGNQVGEVKIIGPYKTMTCRVLASVGTKTGINVSVQEKRFRHDLVRAFLDYRMGRIEESAWRLKSYVILKELSDAAMEYAEYQMLRAYLLCLDGQRENASDILLQYQDKTYTREDHEFAGIYLYLCHLSGIFKDEEGAVKRIQSFYRQKNNSLILFWILLQMDASYEEAPARALLEMNDLYERGCSSPILYLEALKIVQKDLNQLRRLNEFWIQVFSFAARNDLLSEELTERIAHLSRNEKMFSRPLYRVLESGYRKYPSEAILEAICRLIMKDEKGSGRDRFPWFSLAVEQGLRLTRLFEFYVETLDVSYTRELPKPVLMYFQYNDNTLSIGKKAYLYACITAGRNRDPKTFEIYKDSIRAFTRAALLKGLIDENYALLYQEFAPEFTEEREIRQIASLLFTERVYCDDPAMRAVIVCHNQLAAEEVYPLMQGVAYPRLFTEDAVLLFQDEKQRRYGSTVACSRRRLLNETPFMKQALALENTDKGVLLYACEREELTLETLPWFIRVCGEEAFSGWYRDRLMKKVLAFAEKYPREKALNEWLAETDVMKWAAADRGTFLNVLIDHGFYEAALGVIAELGYEGADPQKLLELGSGRIRGMEASQVPDEEILALCQYCFGLGKKNVYTAGYLMEHLWGSMKLLTDLWYGVKDMAEDETLTVFEERLLSLYMFTEDYRPEGEEILSSYCAHRGKERIIVGYLTHMSYGIFVREKKYSPFMKEQLLRLYQDQRPSGMITRLALLKILAAEAPMENPKEASVTMEIMKAILKECMDRNLTFSFFSKLPESLLETFQLDDKFCVECHAEPGDQVTLHYYLETGLEKTHVYRTEPLAELSYGIFTKTFTLFFGETLHYYFRITHGEEKSRTAETVYTPEHVKGDRMSRYHMLNQLLSVRKLGQENVRRPLEAFVRRDRFVKETFTIEKESK